MNKIVLLSFLIVSLTATAQNTNTFPNSGNVGIGTNTPSTELEVNGKVKAKTGLFTNDDGSDFVFQLGEELTTNHRNIRFYINNNATGSQSIFSEGWYDSNNKRRFINQFKSSGDTYLNHFDANGSEFYKLDYKSGTDKAYIHMPKPNSRIVIGSWGSYLPEHKFVVKEGSAMIEGNILTNSNIGIGTNSFTDGAKTYRLSISGNMRAHEIKVYTDWADFVFEKDYELPTLEDVELFINENGHLKDIPSNEEVEENGIEVGEMNKLLLQKIEELTLYLIEQNKEIVDMKKEIKALKLK